MGSMKILHLIDSGGLYGAEMMLMSLASEQLQLGHHPVIGSIRKPGLPEKPIEEEARRRGLEVIAFPMRPGPNPFGASRLLAFARKLDIDIIHSHGYKTNIMLGLLPSWLRRIPIISTLHGWTSTGRWTKMRLNEELDALSLRFVDKIVLVNQGMLEKPKIRSLPQKNLCIVNNGIEVAGSGASSRGSAIGEVGISEIRTFCDGGAVVASIGRLSEEKGFSYLVEAVQRVRQEIGEDVRLLLVGDGPLRGELQRQADESGLHENFLITGYLKNARDLLGFADIYAISSLTEGLPITLLEAMASKTPVIATAVGGIPYVVQDEREALLVKPQDVQALAQAIIKLIRDDSLAACLAENALLKVAEEYSSNLMAEKYLGLYRDVLESC
jgi:glycosyltransferase involved in cell wall biosynthesis